jgi:hypothetical protein
VQLFTILDLLAHTLKQVLGETINYPSRLVLYFKAHFLSRLVYIDGDRDMLWNYIR